MDKGFIRKIIAAVYIILIIFIEMLGFAYSNQEDGSIKENFVDYENGWTINGVDVKFPYEAQDEFRISNVLPAVYGDQFLFFRCYYESAVVYIDGKEVYRTLDQKLFNVSSNVGKKEIHVRMKPEYSGKRVDIDLNLQQSLYGAEIYGSVISTRSGYGIYILKNEWLQISIAVILMFFGFCEALVAAYYIIKRSHILR